MDEKLNDAYASLQAAHDAGNTEDATKLADYIDTLKAQQAPVQISQPTTGAVLPAIGGVVGGVAGTGTTIASKGAELIHALDKFGNPQQQPKTGYNPRGSSVEESVQNWRSYADAQNEAAKSVRRDAELHKKYPGFTRPNLPHLQPTIPTTAENMLSRAANIGTMKPITGLTMGANAIDLAQQYNAGNPIQSTFSGLGLIGGAAPYIKKLPPKWRGIGAATSVAAPIINRALDQFTNSPEEKASGGLVHLAGGGQPESKLKKITKHIPMPATANLALNLGLGASDISQSHENLQKNLQAGNYGSAANNAIDLGSTVSPYMLVPSIYQGGRAASEFARNQLAENPHYRQQMQDMSSTPMGGAMTGDAGLAAQIMGQHEFEEDPGPYGHLLRDSNLPHHAAGGKIIEAGADIAKKLFTPRETKILRASEALAPHEGKWLNLTQSDRMRSTEGDLGGPGFSKFQLEHPDYAEAQAAWGVGKKPTASGIVNVNKRYPEGQSIWAPMIGSETQHHSNQHVYDALTNEFNRQAAMGKLPPELQARINARMQNAPSTKGMFPEGFDIGNPEHLAQYGDTFNRRGEVSKVLSGEGVGGTKGRVIDYPGIMQEMTDPMTMGAPTHSMGTRLFNLTGEVEHRPDLHSAFPYILKGEDQGVAFAPVPKELGIQDFINQFKEFKGREPGYYDLTRTTPSQQITDKYLKSLDEAGHKKGGKVKKAKK